MWRLLAPRWLVGHLVVVSVAAAFLRLGWWQWEHARAGNTLSYGYALQWPAFAAFGVFMWIRYLWQRPPSHPAGPPRTGADGGSAPKRPKTQSTPTAPVGVNWTYSRDGLDDVVPSAQR